MKTKQWIVLGLGLAFLLSACGPQLPEITPTVDPNSGPQKEYPEFTLEAQKAAMQEEEELREKSRIEGLRDQIPRRTGSPSLITGCCSMRISI